VVEPNLLLLYIIEYQYNKKYFEDFILILIPFNYFYGGTNQTFIAI